MFSQSNKTGYIQFEIDNIVKSIKTFILLNQEVILLIRINILFIQMPILLNQGAILAIRTSILFIQIPILLIIDTILLNEDFI
jgi:hypothetical protein